MYNQGGQRQTIWLPVGQNSNVPPEAGETAINRVMSVPGLHSGGRWARYLERWGDCLGFVLLALALVSVAVVALQSNWQDAIDQRERRIAEMVLHTGQQIDAALQSSATLAQVLANRPAEPGGVSAIRAVLSETMEHAPMVYAIVLADPSLPPVSVARQRSGGVDDNELPPTDTFTELAPRHLWDGVKLLHLSDISGGSGLVGLRARAISGRQVTVYLRCQDLPAVGQMSGRSWLFGQGLRVVAVPNDEADRDSAYAILRATDVDQSLRHHIAFSRASLPDGLHQLISSRLEIWPLTFVADIGPVQSANFFAVLRRFGSLLLLFVCGMALLLAGAVQLGRRMRTPMTGFERPDSATECLGPLNNKLDLFAHPPSAVRIPSPPTSSPSHGKPAARVLLVDDNDMVRDSIARRLRLIGYDVVEASDAETARHLLDTKLDILITDVVLHHAVDGWALAEMARRINPNLPLVFISGYLSARQPGVMASDELASFVRKPLHSAELQAVIEGLLALRETRRLSAAVG